MSKGGSKSSTTSQSTTNAYDQRKAVGDSGVLAESGSTVLAGVDARTFDDHSSLSIDASDHSSRTNVDARDLSDHSQFTSIVETTDARDMSSVVSTSDSRQYVDSRDFSDQSSFSTSTHAEDNSVTTINAADAEVLKATASGAFSAANLVTAQSTQLLDMALKFGDQASLRAAQAQIGAVTQLSDVTKQSVSLAQQAAGIVAENAKSPDQAISEKLVKGGVVVAALFAVLFFFFRPSR